MSDGNAAVKPRKSKAEKGTSDITKTGGAPAKKAAVKKTVKAEKSPERDAPKRAPRKTKASADETAKAIQPVVEAGQKFGAATEKAAEAFTALAGAMSEQNPRFSKASAEQFQRADAVKERRERAPATVAELRAQTQGKGPVHRAAPHRPARLSYNTRRAPYRYGESDREFPYGGFAHKGLSKKQIMSLNLSGEIRHMKRVVADAKLAAR